METPKIQRLAHDQDIACKAQDTEANGVRQPRVGERTLALVHRGGSILRFGWELFDRRARVVRPS